MRRHHTLLLMSLLLMVARPSSAEQRNTQDIESLIDGLTAATTVALHGDSQPLRGSRFWLGPPLTEEQRFDDFETYPPELMPIVARGVRALPALLRHITDDRPTKASEGGGNVLIMWGDRYEFRFADPLKQPPDVETGAEDRSTTPYRSSYTQTVGDLCFSAVGQIVNRSLHSLVSRPGLVVNSPVRNPALAAAVRQEWSGLTAKAHRRSLVGDLAFDKGYEFYRLRDALDRLIYYYPHEAEPVVHNLLSLPVDDSCNSLRFVSRNLAQVNDAEVWRRSVKDFVKQHGRLHRQCLYLDALTDFALFPFPEDEYLPYPRVVERLNVRAILRQVYPDRDLYHPPFRLHTHSSGMGQVIRAAAQLRSDRIDSAILSVLRRLRKPPGKDKWVSDSPLDLGLACVDALSGKRWDRELVDYCERRLAGLESSVEDENLRDGYRLRLSARLTRLRGF